MLPGNFVGWQKDQPGHQRGAASLLLRETTDKKLQTVNRHYSLLSYLYFRNSF
mgnify:CR=1 FL=1